mmetsp:Transcript_5245/g.11073  ORF Transcript_5245/g.11073 Transcript_5245/m.11073 type:complete len:213 (-) Transcript_5245:348-986(-)
MIGKVDTINIILFFVHGILRHEHWTTVHWTIVAKEMWRRHIHGWWHHVRILMVMMMWWWRHVKKWSISKFTSKIIKFKLHGRRRRHHSRMMRRSLLLQRRLRRKVFHMLMIPLCILLPLKLHKVIILLFKWILLSIFIGGFQWFENWLFWVEIDYLTLPLWCATTAGVGTTGSTEFFGGSIVFSFGASFVPPVGIKVIIRVELLVEQFLCLG